MSRSLNIRSEKVRAVVLPLRLLILIVVVCSMCIRRTIKGWMDICCISLFFCVLVFLFCVFLRKQRTNTAPSAYHWHFLA